MDSALLLAPQDTFVRRHIGPNEEEIATMLATIGAGSLDELIDATVPAAIRLRRPLQIPAPRAESDVLAELRALASKNQIFRSYLGMGYWRIRDGTRPIHLISRRLPRGV